MAMVTPVSQDGQTVTGPTVKVEVEVATTSSASSPQSGWATSDAFNGDPYFRNLLSPAEVKMAEILAGSKLEDRKLMEDKLREWFTWFESTIRVPVKEDSKPCKAASVIEPDIIIRVWNTMFYAVGMADNQSRKKHVADFMLGLASIFAAASRDFVYIQCMEWFVRTLKREWRRCDDEHKKKMLSMILKRFLRKTFGVLEEKKWRNRVLEGFIRVITRHVFNNSARDGIETRFFQYKGVLTPSDMQISFVRVFVGQLAKVEKGRLEFKKFQKLISVFIQELKVNPDQAVLEAIRDAIFCRMMRESDLGIAYRSTNGPLTRVKYNLPKLKISEYQEILTKVREKAGQAVDDNNKKVMFSVTTKFEELIQGKYPLEEEDGKQPAILKEKLSDKAKQEQRCEKTSSDNSNYFYEYELPPDHIINKYIRYLEEDIGGKGDMQPDHCSASNSIKTGTEEEAPAIKRRKIEQTITNETENSATGAVKPMTAANPATKRVVIDLSKNREHPYWDYSLSVARNPAIPFDKMRRPGRGLLKLPVHQTPPVNPA